MLTGLSMAIFFLLLVVSLFCFQNTFQKCVASWRAREVMTQIMSGAYKGMHKEAFTHLFSFLFEGHPHW